LFINTVHNCSISPCHRKSQPRHDRYPWAAWIFAVAALAACGAAPAGPPSCQSTLGPASVVGKPLATRATLPAEESLMLVIGHRYLIEVDAFSPGAAVQPYAANLLENIKRRNLKVDRIVPLHGAIVPFGELLKTQ